MGCAREQEDRGEETGQMLQVHVCEEKLESRLPSGWARVESFPKVE